jgi:hypothetical protein
MKVLTDTDTTPELADIISRRHAAGIDLYDHKEAGTYVMAPAARSRHGAVIARLLGVLDPLARAHGYLAAGPINVGTVDTYRVPDAAILTADADLDELYLTGVVAVAIEVLSPGEDRYAKADHYARYGVAELWLIYPAGLVRISDLANMVDIPESSVLGVTTATLSAQLGDDR